MAGVRSDILTELEFITRLGKFRAMQVSLRSLLLFVAALCVALTLTQMDFVHSGLVLMTIIIIANFTLTKRAWRYGTYGSLAGIFVTFLIMLEYIYFAERHAATLGDANMARIRIFENWRGFVVPIGALVGGTLGLLLFGNRKRTESAAPPAESDVEPEVSSRRDDSN